LTLGAEALAAGLTGVAWAQPARPDLVVARGSPAEAARQALAALGGMARFVAPNQVVAIKPNASFASPPEWGATTHPGVLCAVIEECLAAGARRVLVVDHTMGDARRAFARSGIQAAVDAQPRAKLVSLDEPKGYETVDVPGGAALRSVEIASVVRRADVLINLPTAKAHTATGVSLGLKNLMGLVWDRDPFHNEMDLHVGVADLATAIVPHLTLIDAVTILQTNGPTGPGDVLQFGGVVAGTDPVAVDACAVGLSPWNGQTLAPDEVGYLRYAAARGVGTLDLASLQIAELG
jgi:uncharacterized protein (DUF362 family)